MSAARQRAADELPQSDRLGDFPHPRETFVLFGHEAAEAELRDAFDSGKLHHAWLIGGPSGIGKATLAYRFARFLLKHGAASAPPPPPTGLEVDPDDAAARLLAQGAHGNVMTLCRPVDKNDRKKLMTVIPVDEVRRLNGFFGQHAAAAGWRIVIVDHIDEMNVNAANALLKLLEEPPERALFLLISHAPGRLLPTIRSRCRTLMVKPLDDSAIRAVLASQGYDDTGDALNTVVRLAAGSAGRALQLAEGDGTEIHEDMVDLLATLPSPHPVDLHAFADSLAGRARDQSYKIFCFLLLDWLRRAARDVALNQTGGSEAEAQLAARMASVRPAADWLEVRSRIDDMMTRADGLHLDRKTLIINIFSLLSQAMRGEPL